MSSPELEAAVELGKQNMPMDRLFHHYGLGEFVGKDTRKRKECPWCGRLGTFGPYYIEKLKAWTFRCFGDGCEASKENRPHGGDEIGFVGLQERLTSRKDAMWRFLEIAGVERPKFDKQRNQSEDSEPPSAPKQEPDPEPDLTTPHPPDPPEPGKFHVEQSPEPAVTPEAALEAFFGPPPAQPPEPPEPPAEPPPPPKPPGSGAPKPIMPWERFLGMLQLTAKDRAQIKKERGLSDALIDKLKFRSNTKYNEAALQVMREEFPMRELIAMGLYKMGSNGVPVPQRQFTGWGPVKAEKVPLAPKTEEVETVEKEQENEDDEEKTTPFAQVERPLIPYLDRFGRCFTIRPHKGNLAKPDRLDDDTCGGHVYSGLLLADTIEANDGVLVITEGEWKAAALYQCGFAAISLPGTGFVRNPLFRQELVSLLSEFRVREVIIVFDNENRDHFSSPYYRQDPWTRYDTSVYAKYIAWDLLRKTPTPPTLKQVRIGWLPNEWRKDASGKDSGKIDWDTALAQFIARSDTYSTGLQTAKLAFRKVLDDAVFPAKFVETFLPEEAAPIVAKKLGDLWHDPLLPAGGRRERRLAARLDQLNGNSPPDLVMQARNLSRAFRKVIGTYYERRPPTEKRLAVLAKMKEKTNADIELAEKRTDAAADAEIKRLKLERKLLSELMDGEPEALSNFTMRCEFCLHSTDGTTHRMIQFRDHHGRKSDQIKVDGTSLGGPNDFRVFCLEKTQGIASWRGGQKHLEKVVEDMIHSSADRDIYEVESYGYHPKTRMWFFGDCAYSPTCETILPDSSGVCWWLGQGYRVDAHSEQRDVGFEQGDPLLQVGKLSDIRVDPSYGAMEPLKYLVSELENNLFSTIGDYDAMLALGVFLSYFAGPEIFAKHRAQPGLWLYGRKGGGKTTIARWLMRLHGFAELNGTRITKDTTPVAMTRNLAQNSFLAFWFEEFRTDLEDLARKESVLRGAYDRSGASKGVADDSNKTRSVKAKTTPLVSGESSSGDGATRSRYVHVLVAKSRREKSKETWRLEHLESLSRHFHHIGRYIMENRTVFAKLSMEILERWMKSPQVCAAIPDQRTRLVHGPALSCILALNSMLGIWGDALSQWTATPTGEWNPTPSMPTAWLADFTIQHSQQAFEDVEDDTMVNKYWQTVITAIQRSEIPRGLFVLGEYFVDEHGRLKSDRDAMYAGKPVALKKTLIFSARAVFDAYAEYVRRTTGAPPPLSYKDIQREISREPFFIPPPSKGGPTDKERVHRQYISGQRVTCWAIEMAKFPHGTDFLDALHETPDEAAPGA